MSDSDPRPRRGRFRRLARVASAAAQERIAATLGVSRARRTETVVAMLDSNARRAPGYWLQLFLATGIAALGLALGSTAVVIGGMLVSPLMGPIVELGMGFAVGSSLLVIRAFLRVLLSVLGVVAAAAVITLALPFHQVTPEITARTAPTLLDLLIAVFCAIAAAYTTVRQTADTTAAAAGTAIGIALVPPLCVVGYGLGTASGEVAAGAALLFTANFSAIVLVAVISFLLLGYNYVDAAALEHDYLEVGATRTDRLARRAHMALRSAFGSRYGLATRLLIPTIVLASVAVPLSRALDEVAWEFRVRDGIQRIVASESQRAVQSALTVERNSVALRLLIVGSPQRAAELQQQLAVRIASLAGVEPAVTVLAVPDANMLEASLTSETRAAAARSTPTIDIAELERQVGTAVIAAWPRSAGRLLGWSVDVTPRHPPRITLRHLGPPLGAAAEEMLGRSLALPLRTPVRVVDVALQPAPLVAAAAADSSWLAGALAMLDEVPSVDSAFACVERPARTRLTRNAVAPAIPVNAVDAALSNSRAARAGRLVITAGSHWSIRIAVGPCIPVPADSAVS